MENKQRFSIQPNEGSFFDEPWLCDAYSGEEYRYDSVPLRIRRAFAKELRDRGKMTPEEAAMIIGFVIG